MVAIIVEGFDVRVRMRVLESTGTLALGSVVGLDEDGEYVIVVLERLLAGRRFRVDTLVDVTGKLTGLYPVRSVEAREIEEVRNV